MSLNADFSFISLDVADGSATFVAPFPCEVVEARFSSVADGAVAVGTTAGEAAGGKAVLKTKPSVAKTTVGGNQPNDTGVGYANVIAPAVPNPVPVAVADAGDEVAVTAGANVGGSVILVLQKK